MQLHGVFCEEGESSPLYQRNIDVSQYGDHFKVWGGDLGKALLYICHIR